MWFKQIQLFQLNDSFDYSKDNLVECLEKLLFKPCLPSMPSSMGWSRLVDEDNAPLVRAVNNCLMFCLQIEEKVLPAAVIRQALTEKIKQIQTAEDRKVRQKEKLSLKDEVIMTLLPRAFTKLTQVHAYIDTKYHWLVLGTNSTTKTEQFLTMFKKSISEEIHPFELKKLSPIMTHWIKEKNYPSSLAVEKSCLLQDPKQQNRIIRCQQQDLFVNGIQSLIKDGCEIKQLALSYRDQIKFVLAEDFSLRNLQFEDEIREQVRELEPETIQQQLDADFLIMTTTLCELLKELLGLFIKPPEASERQQMHEELLIS